MGKWSQYEKRYTKIFGIEFNLLLHDSKSEDSLADKMKERGRHYLLELLREPRQRLPANVEQLESVADLTPSVNLGIGSFWHIYSNAAAKRAYSEMNLY